MSTTFLQQTIGNKLLLVLIKPIAEITSLPLITIHNDLLFMICCESILKMLWTYYFSILKVLLLMPSIFRF